MNNNPYAQDQALHQERQEQNVEGQARQYTDQTYQYGSPSPQQPQQYPYYNYNQPYPQQGYTAPYQPDQNYGYQNYQAPYPNYGNPVQPQPQYNYQHTYVNPTPAYNQFNKVYDYITPNQQNNFFDSPYNPSNNNTNYNGNNVQKKDDIVPSLSTILNKKDLPSINQNINQKTDYWDVYNNNNKINNDVKDVINSILPKNVKLFDDQQNVPHPDANKIVVSNLFQIQKNFGTLEEFDNPVVPNQNNNNGFQNWFNNSYMPCKQKNQLDNLQQLLQQSVKYQEARGMISSGKYTDKYFEGLPAIKGFGERKDYTDSEMADFLWLRPEQFFKGTPKVYDTIDPDDILQGGLGDCYFLAAIASIARKPQRLERIFLTKNYNTEGIYVVALCINGLWEDVVCDDRFPCRKLSKDVAFNGSKTNELWVMLLEKAWAKLHGGYLNIAAGLTREALRDLTGASAKTFFTVDSKEILWKNMIESHNKDYILTAGSDDLSFGSDAYVSKIGIAGSHAYSVLGVFEIISNGGRNTLLRFEDTNKYQPSQKQRIIKLRNPWGKGEWKGDWSDKSPKWTPELQQQLGVKNQEDGVFFMDFDNFCKYYSDVQVCYYHNNHKYSAIKITSETNDRVCLKFTIQSPGMYYFSINQKNRRFFPKDKNYNYSPLSMIVGCIEQSKQVKYVGSSMKQDKENWIEYMANPGDYFVYINTPWKSIVNEFSFSVYGPNTCDIKQVQMAELPPNFFTQLMLKHAKDDNSTKMLTLSDTSVFYKRWDDQTGLGYLYFENRDKQMVADVTVEMTECRNIRLLAPFTGFRPNLSINPGESKIIGYEPTGNPSNCGMRIIASMKATGQQKKDMVRKEGTKMNRYYLGKDVGIYLYTLYSMDGAMYHYINQSSNYSLSEQVEFELTDCCIEGNIGGYLEFMLGPGEEKIVSIQRAEGKTNFSARIKKINYDVNAVS